VINFVFALILTLPK